MICFNDTAAVDNFEVCKNNLLTFLQQKLPNKSSFELTDLPYKKLNYINIHEHKNNKTKNSQNYYTGNF